MPETPGGLKALDTIAAILAQFTGIGSLAVGLIPVFKIAWQAIEALRKQDPNNPLVLAFDANLKEAERQGAALKASADARIAELRAQLQ